MKLYELRLPNQRHYINKVTQKTVSKNKNTVIEPWVDVMADVEAIRTGKAKRRGNTFTINHRIYGVEDNTLYPMYGHGFHELNRAAYKALGVYNKFGNSARANQILDWMTDKDGKPIQADDRQVALIAWQAGQGG